MVHIVTPQLVRPTLLIVNRLVGEVVWPRTNHYFWHSAEYYCVSISCFHIEGALFPLLSVNLVHRLISSKLMVGCLLYFCRQ